MADSGTILVSLLYDLSLFLNTVRDHQKMQKKWYFMPLGGLEGLFCCFFGSVLVNQPTVHRGGVLARVGSVAVAVSVDDRGKVICNM